MRTSLVQCITQLFALEQEKISVVDESAEQRGTSRIVEWDQAQCLCIQCNALLCSWPNRTSNHSNCIEHPGRSGLPSINLDFMLRGRGSHQAQVAKCQMFLHYLAKQKQRIDAGDPLNRKISFVRHKVVATLDTQGTAAVGGGGSRVPTPTANGVQLEPDWASSSKLLKAVEVKPLHESIDEAKEMLRADFANGMLSQSRGTIASLAHFPNATYLWFIVCSTWLCAFVHVLTAMIGGGSISHGCVQEEIMFACHPELNCARLVFTPMNDNEAFILIGAEQFALPQGYAGGLTCGGLYEDHTPLQGAVDGESGGQLASYITAIDALDYRYLDPSGVVQFHVDHIRRELLKAFAGFALSPEAMGGRQTPDTLATGNWSETCNRFVRGSTY